MTDFTVLHGYIARGDQIGRTLGFPTANLCTTDFLPVNGVYVACMRWDGMVRYGMLNIGTRPTVEGKEQRVEMHLFGFCGNLYGKHADIEPLYFLRKEQKFSDTEQLRKQLESDREQSVRYLISNGFIQDKSQTK